MSHTLHRYGINEADLQDDYVVFAIFREFEKIVMKYNPVNYGDMRTGNKFNVGMETVGSSYHDNSIVHAVFTDEATVTKVLKDLYEANLDLSIVVSGLTDHTAACCHGAGIAPASACTTQRMPLPQACAIEPSELMIST